MESRSNYLLRASPTAETARNPPTIVLPHSTDSLSRSVQSHERLSHVLSNVWSQEVSSVFSQNFLGTQVTEKPDSATKPTNSLQGKIQLSKSAVSNQSLSPASLDKQRLFAASQTRLPIITESQTAGHRNISVTQSSTGSQVELKKPQIDPAQGVKSDYSFQITNNPKAHLSAATGGVSSATVTPPALDPSRETISSVRTRERLLKLSEIEQQHSASNHSVKSATSNASNVSRSQANMGKKKSFLHGLFGKWTKQNDLHSKNSLEAASSTFSLLSTGSEMLPLYKSTASDRTDATLAEYRAIKAHHLDEIFAKAALSSVNLAAGDRNGLHKGRKESVVSLPSDVPPIYTVLLTQLENDEAHDKLVPFVLKRFIEFGYERKFLDHMMARVKADEESIHHLCAANAQVLTESSRDFVELNDRIDQLREDVVTLDDRDVYATQLREIRYAEKETRITSCILNNVALLMERINAIRPALQAFGQALKCSAAPVKALRSLCTAQENTIHLPPHLGFVTWLANSIPDLKYSLLDTCTRRVVRSLESLRVYTPQAGFGILHTVSLRSGIGVEPFASQQPDLPLLRFAEMVDHNKTQKDVTLRPLNHFRHIVKTLVNHPTEINNDFLFHCYVTYMAERHVQIVRSLENVEIGTLKQLRSCIQQVVGIFGMEMFISYYVTGINAESYYDDLWREMFPKISVSLDNGVKLVLTENDYTEVRNLLRLFAASMTVLRCKSDGILGLIETLGDHYCKVLDQTLSAAIHMSLSRDIFTYHILDNEMDEKSFLEIFEPWRKNAMNGRTDFPKTLPFSQSVPEIYALIKEHISANVSVDMDLGLDVEESLQRIVEITNTALTSNLYEQVTDIFNSGFLLVKQYVQLYQNLIQLQNCLPYLESFISKELKIHPQSGQSVSLRSASVTFEALRLGTEQQLIGELTGYIQAVLHDSATDLGTVSETISEEAGKLMTFVKEFFESVTVLRPEFAEKAFATIWTEIPSELETVWVYDSTVISRDGLQQLLVDIEYYQLILRTYGFKTVKNAGPSDNEGFELLMQLIRLILSDDWAEYMGKFGQTDSPYTMVPPGSALRVVAKLNDMQLAASKSNMYLSVKTERDKKQRRELLLIQLDDLATIGRVAHFKVPKSKSNITLKSTVSVVQSMVSKDHM